MLATGKDLFQFRQIQNNDEMRVHMAALFGGQAGLPQSVLPSNNEAAARRIRQESIDYFLTKNIVENKRIRYGMSLKRRTELADLLSRIFVWSPEERLSAAEVLQHRFLRA